MNSEGHFTFSTYNFKFGYGHDNVDSYKGIEYGDDLADWYWIYFGYSRARRSAVAYMRFRDREVIEYFEDTQHIIPKYFGLYTGYAPNENCYNGDMKDVHLCHGKECTRDDNFEEVNCAVPIEKADPAHEDSLGPDRPGCKLPPYCEDGMHIEQCKNVTDHGSAEVEIVWPPVDPSDLIP